MDDKQTEKLVDDLVNEIDEADIDHKIDEDVKWEQDNDHN
jgi:hypothetical protein